MAAAAVFHLRMPGSTRFYCAAGASEPKKFGPSDEEGSTEAFVAAQAAGYTEKVTGVAQSAAGELGGECVTVPA